MEREREERSRPFAPSPLTVGHCPHIRQDVCSWCEFLHMWKTWQERIKREEEKRKKEEDQPWCGRGGQNCSKHPKKNNIRRRLAHPNRMIQELKRLALAGIWVLILDAIAEALRVLGDQPELKLSQKSFQKRPGIVCFPWGFFIIPCFGSHTMTPSNGWFFLPGVFWQDR